MPHFVVSSCTSIGTPHCGFRKCFFLLELLSASSAISDAACVVKLLTKIITSRHRRLQFPSPQASSDACRSPLHLSFQPAPPHDQVATLSPTMTPTITINALFPSVQRNNIKNVNSASPFPSLFSSFPPGLHPSFTSINFLFASPPSFSPLARANRTHSFVFLLQLPFYNFSFQTSTHSTEHGLHLHVSRFSQRNRSAIFFFSYSQTLNSTSELASFPKNQKVTWSSHSPLLICITSSSTSSSATVIYFLSPSRNPMAASLGRKAVLALRAAVTNFSADGVIWQKPVIASSESFVCLAQIYSDKSSFFFRGSSIIANSIHINLPILSDSLREISF